MVRTVPEEAKKTINAGRLKGMTDINPMWRIKCLTETFGPVGFGWWYRINDMHIEKTDTEAVAVVNITMWIRWNGETSEGFDGTGGSKFIASERNGMYVSDEMYKMALTDAISVCAKAIGVGADVYYAKDRTKYTAKAEPDKISEIKQLLVGRDMDKFITWASETIGREIGSVDELQPAEAEAVVRRLRNG